MFEVLNLFTVRATETFGQAQNVIKTMGVLYWQFSCPYLMQCSLIFVQIICIGITVWAIGRSQYKPTIKLPVRYSVPVCICLLVFALNYYDYLQSLPFVSKLTFYHIEQMLNRLPVELVSLSPLILSDRNFFPIKVFHYLNANSFLHLSH